MAESTNHIVEKTIISQWNPQKPTWYLHKSFENVLMFYVVLFNFFSCYVSTWWAMKNSCPCRFPLAISEIFIMLRDLFTKPALSFVLMFYRRVLNH